MKRLYILLSILLLSQYKASAQTDSFIYLSFDHTVFTGNTTIPGGVVPHFSDPGIEAITNRYAFKEFAELCSSCAGGYWRDVYKVVVNNTYAADELKASYPAVFSGVEKYHTELLGVKAVSAAATNVLSPNPAGKELFIDHAAAMHLAGISAIDMTGKTIQLTTGKTNKINTEQLPDGVYLFRLSFDDRAPVVERIVVSK